MILLGLGAEMLARLMAADGDRPDTAWLLAGPTEAAVEPTGAAANEAAEPWALAAE